MRGKAYAKKSILFVIVCVFVFLLAGCCTCGRNNANTTDIIAGNSRATGRLEATIAALDGTVIDSRKRITDIIETSRGITDGVERLEYLFGRYEREVEQLLNEIDRIRSETEISVKSDMDSGFDITSVCGSSGNSSYP